MPNYDFRYSLDAQPEARNDGGGQVAFTISAEFRLENSSDPWLPFASHSKTILVPAATLTVINAMPHSTGPERAAKNSAVKDALVANHLSVSLGKTPILTKTAMQAYADANNLAVAEHASLIDYIENVLGQIYPIQFNI